RRRDAELQRPLRLTTDLERRLGLTPASPLPAPAPVDGDRDGVSPPVDCDDTNSRVYPGAPEVPSDGIDQDCNGADAAGRLSASVSHSWRVNASFPRVFRGGRLV